MHSALEIDSDISWTCEEKQLDLDSRHLINNSYENENQNVPSQNKLLISSTIMTWQLQSNWIYRVQLQKTQKRSHHASCIMIWLSDTTGLMFR